jgi:hypothetical protein
MIPGSPRTRVDFKEAVESDLEVFERIARELQDVHGFWTRSAISSAVRALWPAGEPFPERFISYRILDYSRELLRTGQAERLPRRPYVAAAFRFTSP